MPLTPIAKQTYLATITQTGTSTPILTILQNTLPGTPHATRQSAGNYQIILTDGFPEAKTFIHGMTKNGQSFGILGGTTTDQYFYELALGTPPNEINIGIMDKDYNPIELSTALAGDTLYLPEINVFN